MKTRKWVVLAGFACLAGAAWGGELAFYTFAEGTPGAAVAPEAVMNKAAGGAGYAVTAGAVGTGGATPVFSDDVPGPFVYATQACEDCVSEGARSLAFSPAGGLPRTEKVGGYVRLAELGTAIGNLDAFTVEAFVKFAAEDDLNWVDAFAFQTYQGVKCANNYTTTLCAQNTSLVNQGGDVAQSGSLAYRGRWVHVAVTYDRADGTGKAFFHVDHKKVGGLWYTNHLDNAAVPAGRALVLGANVWGNSEALAGKVAFLRVSDRALAASEMMCTRARPPTGTTQMLFYPFRDAAPGTSAETVTNACWAGSFDGEGVAFGADGTAPTFSADRPARYVYGSLDARTPFAVEPGSLVFAGGESAGTGGGVRVPGLASELQFCSEWTFECFFKVDDAKRYWRNVFAADVGQPFKLSVPSGVPQSLCAQELYTAERRQNMAEMSASLGDGTWHHVALVYRGAPDHLLRCYVDYVPAAGGACPDGLPITNAVLPTASMPAFLGCSLAANGEAFVGRLSAVRVSARALGVAEFEVASDSANLEDVEDIVYRWPLDGPDGGGVGTAAAWPNNAWMAQGVGKATSGAPPPRYGAVPPGRSRVFRGAEPIGVNAGCAAFFGYDPQAEEPREAEWAGSYLESRPLVDAVRPESFTYEMFFRRRFEAGRTDGRATHAQLLLGHGRSDNDFDLRVVLYPNVTISLDVTCEGETAPRNMPFKGVTCMDEKWHHLAVTYDAPTKTLRAYYDYEEVASRTLEAPFANNAAYVWRHGRYCNSHGFNGFMDEIMLSNRALTPDGFLRVCAPPGAVILLR